MAVTGFIGRNNLFGWAALNPRVAYAEHKLMDAHRKRECVCQACGEDDPKRLEVHHIFPLWSNPQQAGTDPSGRFITLCSHKSHNCHVRHGHHGNYAEYYVENCVMVCSTIRMIESEQVVIKRGAV